MRRKGLGRGLEALIGAPIGSDGLQEGPATLIPVDHIFPNPYQPRQDLNEEELAQLTESIRRYGLLQPIVVRRKNGGYELVAGERRLRAAKKAGLREVPALIRDCADSEVLALALIENLQREDLNPLEEATAYRALMDQFGWIQEEIAVRVGKARVTVANKLRLLDLPPTVQQAVRDGAITEGHALTLLTAPDEEILLEAFQQVIEKSLTVRQTQSLINKLTHRRKTRRLSVAPHWLALGRVLEEELQSVVRIRRTRRGGVLEIHFSSEEELDRLIRSLLKDHRDLSL